MNESAEQQQQQQNPTSLDTSIDDMLRRAEEGFMRCYHDCEDSVRQSPAKALVAAVATGYLLHHLPLRAILAAKMRLLAALAPPALALLGAAKVYDYMRWQESANASATDSAD